MVNNKMTPLVNNQWEKFCLAYFEGRNAKNAAIKAGYSVKAARQIASRLLTKADIVVRLQELQGKAASAKIMSVIERKERLTEIAKGEKETVRAIAELNKMEGEYAPIRTEITGKDGAPLVCFTIGQGYLENGNSDKKTD